MATIRVQRVNIRLIDADRNEPFLIRETCFDYHSESEISTSRETRTCAQSSARNE